MVEQGEIISLQGYKMRFVVVSKNTMNESGFAILCPILADSLSGNLVFPIETKRVRGFVMCDSMKRVDLNSRGYKSIDRIPITKMIFILDMIQSVFDYI